MIGQKHKKRGSNLSSDSVAIVAGADGKLVFYTPHDEDQDLCLAQLLLAAVALRSTDEAWVQEQIDLLVEVRSQQNAAASN